jgi:hypothetical protein
MMRLAVIGMLALSGALAGYVTAQFLPRSYVSRTTVAFTEPVSEGRCAYAAGETLSAVALKPIVVQSAYYAKELDYTPEEEIVERIRQSASIQCRRAAGKDVFQVEFRDDDKYLTLEMTRVLVQETGRNANATMKIIEPVRTGTTGPSPLACVLWGMGAGVVVGIVFLALART